MKLLEIKNNLVKITYNENDKISLAKFIAIVDGQKSYVGQIVNLKADINANYAVARLVFTFNNEGIVDNYDGSIPSMNAQLSKLDSSDILKLLPIEKPIALGELAQQETMLKVDETIFEKNLTICAEKFDNISTIIKNCTAQLAQYNEKVVVIDIDHTFGEYEPIRFKRDFKLPLNAKMIDFIYENDLNEVDATSKAVIQDIFYEVQEYTKTIDGNFIPFDTFVKVVSQQYEQTDIPELALLKHKLLKYQEENVFAENKDELEGLKNAISENQISYIDIADVSDELQKELISYIHTVLNQNSDYMYIFAKINNRNSSKKLLKQLLDNEHIFTTIICSHNYKYLPELKQRAENLIFFAPQTVQHDFASYNTLLNKLNVNEFIVYGALTQNVPFVVELSEFSQENDNSYDVNVTQDETTEESDVLNEVPNNDTDESILNVEPELESENEEVFDFDSIDESSTEQTVIESDDTYKENIPEQNFQELSHEELVEQVAKDVDEVFYTKPTETPSIEEIASPDNLTEDDLDFIDDLATEAPDLNVYNEKDELYESNLELPFEEEHHLEQVNDVEDIETNIEEEVITEEPVLEDFDTEFETENNPEEATSSDFMDEPQPPVVPIYPSEEPILEEGSVNFEQGDMVAHPKYGKGIIEKLIKYGNKTLCSISFENVGRRLLDPAISELQKL